MIGSERSYGMASRSFSLADEVDQSQVQAKYNNGVLELTLPKKAGASSRKEIPISYHCASVECVSIRYAPTLRGAPLEQQRNTEKKS